MYIHLSPTWETYILTYMYAPNEDSDQPAAPLLGQLLNSPNSARSDLDVYFLLRPVCLDPKKIKALTALGDQLSLMLAKTVSFNP